MIASKKNINYKFSMLLVLVGLAIWLALPNLPTGRAHASGGAGKSLSQKPSVSGLSGEQRTALEKLYAQFKAGAPFSEEESNLLRKFGAGGTLTDLEADVLITRALYDYYIAAKALTKAQEELLDQYTLSVARRPTGVADLKTQLLNKRIAAAAAAPPHIPQVAPTNDLCSGAEVIPAAGPFPYLTAITADITDATTAGDPPLPSCQNNVSRSIWYRFTPTTTASYTISTCAFDGTASTVEDTVMAIYTSSTSACGGTYTEIPTGGTTDGCDDDSCVSEAFQSVITTQLNAGTTYFVVVWTFASTPITAGKTAVQLHVSQIIPPVNDTCAGAVALSLDTPVNGTNVAAANDYQLSGAACFTGVAQTASTAAGRDAVYSFTAPVAGNYSFKVTNFDLISNLVLYVASSCPAATPGTPVTVGTCLSAANRRASSSAEEVMCLALAASQQVFIFVDENAVTEGSTFTIEVNRCTRETETNDTPATANNFTFGIEGSLTPAGDADFFSLGTPAANSRVFAMIDGVAGSASDFDLRVTTATDTLEYDDLNNDALFGSSAPNIAGTPTTGAATYLRVNQFSGAADEPYRLYAVTQPPMASATSESEPNDTPATADSAANNYFTGSLDGPMPSTDVDLFSFTANAGDLIFLSLDCDPLRDITPINGALALLDSNGATLVSVNDGGSTSCGAGSSAICTNPCSPGILTCTQPFSPGEALVFRAKTTGTYYARVSIGTTSTTGTGAGDYLLSISRNGVAGSPPTTTTIGVYLPSNQTFYLRNTNTIGFADLTIPYGPPGATPIVGDWDGDGVTTIGVYDPSSRTFYLRNSNTVGNADLTIQYGPAGAIPLAGDWDGNGTTTIGVYDPITRTFYLRNSNTVGNADLTIQYGPAGAIPLAGDWDGDGITTIGVYDPTSRTFYLRNSNTPGFADLTIQYGPAGATPVVGDFDGNGTVTIGVYDPSTQTFYLRNTNSIGFADLTIQYGPAGATPLAGDWDGL